MRKVEALFFDCDGVIVDTEPVHYKSFLEVLKPFGISFDYDTYRAKYIGFDDRDGFREILQEHGIEPVPSLLEKLIMEKNEKVLHYAPEVRIFEGVDDFIKSARQANMSLALVSGALHSEIIAFLTPRNLYRFFDVIVTADDVKKSKPDPESYLLAKKRLESLLGRSLPSRACVVFEDTPTGVEAAKRAGLRVVAITTSFGAEDLKSADLVIPGFPGFSLKKLHDLLDG